MSAGFFHPSTAMTPQKFAQLIATLDAPALIALACMLEKQSKAVSKRLAGLGITGPLPPQRSLRSPAPRRNQLPESPQRGLSLKS